MDDAEKEPREHQTNCCLRINPRTAKTRSVKVGDLPAQPAKVKNLVDAGEDVIIGDKITQRSADKELQLVAGPTADHATLHMMSP